MKAIVLALLAVFEISSAAADDSRAAVTKIVTDLVSVCQIRGILACEPQIEGAGAFFDVVRVFDQVKKDDVDLQQFVNRKYGPNSGFHFEVLSASLKLNIRDLVHKASRSPLG